MRKQVLEVKKNQQEHKARIEMLEFQMAEIEAANLQAGEDLALNQERDKLLNHKKYCGYTDQCLQYVGQ